MRGLQNPRILFKRHQKSRGGRCQSLRWLRGTGRLGTETGATQSVVQARVGPTPGAAGPDREQSRSYNGPGGGYWRHLQGGIGGYWWVLGVLAQLAAIAGERLLHKHAGNTAVHILQGVAAEGIEAGAPNVL